MKYPKIETLFNRDPETFKVIEGDYRLEEFTLIDRWYVTEKIDGTNIRVIYYYKHDLVSPVYLRVLSKGGWRVDIRGRTNKAQIPSFLMDYLQRVFTIDKMKEAFPELEETDQVILYGEGYGAGINKKGQHVQINDGKHYRLNPGIRLFDVWIGPAGAKRHTEGWWLEQGNVIDIASKLGLTVVPKLPVRLTEDIVRYVKEGESSLVAQFDSDNPNFLMEGIVARTEPLLLRRNGQRLMFKLKRRDFARE